MQILVIFMEFNSFRVSQLQCSTEIVYLHLTFLQGKSAHGELCARVTKLLLTLGWALQTNPLVSGEWCLLMKEVSQVCLCIKYFKGENMIKQCTNRPQTKKNTETSMLAIETNCLLLLLYSRSAGCQAGHTKPRVQLSLAFQFSLPTQKGLVTALLIGTAMRKLLD